jgi:hypothetical protein
MRAAPVSVFDCETQLFHLFEKITSKTLAVRLNAGWLPLDDQAQ